MPNKIDKLEQMLKFVDAFKKALTDEGLTKKEFVESLDNIVKLVKRVEKRLDDAISGMSETHIKLKDKIKSDSELSLTDLRALMGKEMSRINKSIDDKIKEADTKLGEIKNGENGKDADENRIIKEVFANIKKDIKIPKIEEIENNLPKLGERIRDSLELLKGKDRLDVSAIDGLEELLKGLEKRKGGMMGGLRPSPTGVETPTGTINGTNKVFTVSFTPQWITINGQNLYADNGYALTSVAGVLIITLDNAPSMGKVLRSHY